MRTLRFPRRSTHLHESDFTEGKRLAFHEYNWVLYFIFPKASDVHDDGKLLLQT